MKRILFSLAPSCFICFLFWAGGFNFDHRGEALVMISWLCLFFSGATYFYPGWTEE